VFLWFCDKRPGLSGKVAALATFFLFFQAMNILKSFFLCFDFPSGQIVPSFDPRFLSSGMARTLVTFSTEKVF